MPGSENGRTVPIHQPDPLGVRLEKLVKPLEEEEIGDAELSSLRFARARRILVWLTAQSHYIEAPAFLLFQDGSGTLFVGSKTMEENPGLRAELERVVGSERWHTCRRENGAVDITLTFCHINLEEPIPGVD